MATQLTAERTPSTITAFAQLIQALWPTTIGSDPPSTTTLAILTAQCSLETAAFTSVWNYNYGNIAGTGGDYVMLHAYNGQYRPYRAFASSQDGATAYLGLLHSRYAAALDSAINGDLEGFATNLKAKGYFEEPLDDYYDGLLARYNVVTKQLGGAVQPAPLPWVPLMTTSPAAKAVLGGLLIGGLAFVAKREWDTRPVLRRRVMRYV